MIGYHDNYIHQTNLKSKVMKITTMGAFHHAKLTGQRSVGIPKMEQHFWIKRGQPIEMALVILNSFNEFPNKGKEPVCLKWNGEFQSEYSDRTMWTSPRDVPEYSVQKNQNSPFHSI